jgi:hypothetical protein
MAPKEIHPIFGSKGFIKRMELHLDEPSNVIPVLACGAEIGFRRVDCTLLNNSDGLNTGVVEREHEIAWGDERHGVVVVVPSSAFGEFGRPKETPSHLLAMGLILIHPPEPHHGVSLRNLYPIHNSPLSAICNWPTDLTCRPSLRESCSNRHQGQVSRQAIGIAVIDAVAFCVFVKCIPAIRDPDC